MSLRIHRIAPAAAVAVAGWLTPPASGFFFPGWPGSGEPKTPTLIPPGTPPEANPPSAKPPVDEPPPGVEEPPGPSQTPEPATLTAALIGLAAVGTRVAVKRRKKKV
jgi:hypothetical protein